MEGCGCEEDWARRSSAEREDHGADWGGGEGRDVHGGRDSLDGEERGAAGDFSPVEPDPEVRGHAGRFIEVDGGTGADRDRESV